MVMFLLIIYSLFVPFQQDIPDITVHVRDVNGDGIIATVSVRDGSGQHTIVTQTTDTTGMTSFVGIKETEVRIHVAGQLADGTALTLPGLDAQGIYLMLGTPPTILDLRVEPSGMVVPDPATMIEPERNPVPAYPTAPVAPTITVAPELTVVPDVPLSPDLQEPTPTPHTAFVAATEVPSNTSGTAPSTESDTDRPFWLIPLGIIVLGTALMLTMRKKSP